MEQDVVVLTVEGDAITDAFSLRAKKFWVSGFSRWAGKISEYSVIFAK